MYILCTFGATAITSSPLTTDTCTCTRGVEQQNLKNKINFIILIIILIIIIIIKRACGARCGGDWCGVRLNHLRARAASAHPRILVVGGTFCAAAVCKCELCAPGQAVRARARVGAGNPGTFLRCFYRDVALPRCL